MSQVISYVADLTRQRDRDILETSLADVLFKLLEPQELKLWRVLPHATGARVRLMAGLCKHEPLAISDPWVEVQDLPLLEGLPAMNECWRTSSRLSVATPDGSARHFLPVTSEQEGIGVLELHKPSLSEADLKVVDGLLSIYRNHLAILDYSQRDELTGLLNRKTFEELFAARTGQPTGEEATENVRIIGRRAPKVIGGVWLAVIDIDHFKRVNDSFGHVFGDEVLLLTARLMRATFRAEDALFRFGGEEFAVLLAPTDRAGAAAAVERFRNAVANYRFPQVGALSVSLGYCQASAEAGSVASFEWADAALYYAKQNGRNRSFCYEELVESGKLAPKVQLVQDVDLF